METAETITCREKCCVNGAAHRVIKKVLCVIVIVAVLVWIDASFNILSSSQANKQARTQLQTVFLTNGQVYFGALSRHGIGYWRLDRAHYVQISKATEGGESQETRTTLKKLSDDMHRPQDTLIIPASNILFWQNLRSDSPVAQAIASGQ